MKMKLNFEELPQATAFLLEKVEELTISINEMKQLLKRQTAAKEEMIGINEACEILSIIRKTKNQDFKNEKSKKTANDLLIAFIV